MDNQNKETAIHNKQQLNDIHYIINEIHELNQTLKDIANTLWRISGIKEHFNSLLTI